MTLTAGPTATGASTSWRRRYARRAAHCATCPAAPAQAHLPYGTGAGVCTCACGTSTRHTSHTWHTSRPQALDALEYANGGCDTAFGQRRCAAGHVSPFNLSTVAIGNENCEIDVPKTRPTYLQPGKYEQYYHAFETALRGAWPTIELISNCVNTSSFSGKLPELYDVHMYKVRPRANSTRAAAAHVPRMGAHAQTAPTRYAHVPRMGGPDAAGGGPDPRCRPRDQELELDSFDSIQRRPVTPPLHYRYTDQELEADSFDSVPRRPGLGAFVSEYSSELPVQPPDAHSGGVTAV